MNSENGSDLNSTHLYDLNLFVISITQLYSLVYDTVQGARMRKRQPLGPFMNWVDLFSVMEKKKSIREEVVDALESLGFEEQDLFVLQKIRRTRNSLCHPKVSIEKTASILNKRWQTHPAYASMNKAFTFLKKRNM